MMKVFPNLPWLTQATLVTAGPGRFFTRFGDAMRPVLNPESSCFYELSLCASLMSLCRASLTQELGEDPGPECGTAEQRREFVESLETIH